MNGATIATFNCEWRRTASADAKAIRDRVMACAPDIVCLTEAYRDFFPAGGHLIEAQPDYGYPLVEGRRKVLLWSRKPWSHVDRVGSEELPSGRFVAGSTTTELGEVRVFGLCIPWAHAHVTTGRRDRSPWEDHRAFLRGLARVLEDAPTCSIVIGDFNQTVPRRRQPDSVFDDLSRVVLARFPAVTGGEVEAMGKLAIDHVCLGQGLRAATVTPISNKNEAGKPISDHFGWHVRVSACDLLSPKPIRELPKRQTDILFRRPGQTDDAAEPPVGR